MDLIAFELSFIFKHIIDLKAAPSRFLSVFITPIVLKHIFFFVGSLLIYDRMRMMHFVILPIPFVFIAIFSDKMTWTCLDV